MVAELKDIYTELEQLGCERCPTLDGHFRFLYKGIQVAKLRNRGRAAYPQNIIRAAKRAMHKIDAGWKGGIEVKAK